MTGVLKKMKLTLATLAAIAGLLIAPTASASPELARSKNCMACHAVDKKLVGPSYKDVAAKYANDKDAVTKLAKKIREGGVGSFGQIPMPANPQVSEAEARTLATWVMAQK
jgi:cytochrome c